MRRITLKDGPLDGKTYDVPDSAVRIPAVGGAYRLTPKTGQWEPAKAAATKPARQRSQRARASKPKPAAEVAPADAPVDTATAAVTDAAGHAPTAEDDAIGTSGAGTPHSGRQTT